ncbi:MAG TPA: cobalamin-dependent protein [Phycisphaerae bacterium]|nr:cobalamin-dependent protein [Phycisphaerae bacterium]HNU45957.1 cobalamin-dependent protein [Phycisphaerae bacterium]
MTRCACNVEDFKPEPGAYRPQQLPEHPPRILLAKIGLDGHDRGVKVLARSFRDAGLEVIYTGLWQTCEATMHAAVQEDVDVVGVSLLSAAHMTIMPEMLRLRAELGIDHVPVVLGGIVPVADYPALEQMGVAAVFNPGSPLPKIIDKVYELAAGRRARDARDLGADYEKKDVRALAQLITAIQRRRPLDGFAAPRGKAVVVGVTGAPGVGKSSFIAKLGKELRQRGQRVAVVAVDPSSPVSGGALLGDRLRMMSSPPDRDFFVRSLSSRGEHDGLAPRCREVVDLLNGFGFDYILVETVGAGQADYGIHGVTQRVILVLMPDAGDSIQFSKAGLMEIASSFVINKADLPGADATEGQLRSALGDRRPVWRVCSVRDEGLAAVADWVQSLS